MKMPLNIWAAMISALAPCIAPAQTLAVTVIGGDTGTGIPGATVNAFLGTSDRTRKPVTYQGQTDTAGRYSAAVLPGTYILCVQRAGPYLDPCQWAAASTLTVPGTGTAGVTLRLEKGGAFVLRIHDSNTLLHQVEHVKGEAISASVITASGRQFVLPLAHDVAGTRDYEAILPMNIPLRLAVASAKLLMSDRAGGALNAQGIPFQVSDLSSAHGGAPKKRFVPLPDATFVHVNITGRRTP